MPLSKHVKDRILEALVARNNMLAGSIYVGLSSTEPTEDGENITEPTTGGYARALIGVYNQSATYTFGSPVGDSIKNNAYIYFDQSTGSWGDAPLTHFVLFTAKEGGTFLGYGKLTKNGEDTTIAVWDDKTVVLIPLEGLTISIAGE